MRQASKMLRQTDDESMNQGSAPGTGLEWETPQRQAPTTSLWTLQKPLRVLTAGDSFGVPPGLRRMLEDCLCLLIAPNPVDDNSGMAPSNPDLILFNIGTLGSYRAQEIDVVRDRYGVPVVAVVSHPTPEEVADVAALKADAVVFKPLIVDELRSRLRLAVWASRPEARYPYVDRRRRSRSPTDTRRDDTRDARPQAAVRLYERERVLVRDGRSVHLSAREYALFALLASDPGRVFSVSQILKSVWSDRRDAPSAYVHQYVYALRRKVERDPGNPKIILTVSTFGYKLEG
jgi:two-component system KDP operon response regulator KdpE